MLIREMHHRFDQEIDRIATQDRPDFLPNERDDYLNKGIANFVKQRYAFSPPLLLGFESNQKRTDDLRNLHIKAPVTQSALAPVLLSDGFYEVQLNQLAHRYMFLTDVYIKGCKDECEAYMNMKQWQKDDIKTTYSDPSFKWRRVLGNLGKSTNTSSDNKDLGSLFLYTRDRSGTPQFEIKEVFISYIKTPNEVFFGGYNHINGIYTAGDPQVHCDIDNAFHEEIVTIAAQLAQKDIQDQLGYQLQSAKVQTDKF